MFPADITKIGGRLRGQVKPAFAANGRLTKVKEWFVAEPAVGRESGAAYSVQWTSQHTHNRTPCCCLRWWRTHSSIFELAAKLLTEDAPPDHIAFE